MKPMVISLTAFLVLSACASGDFCDVVQAAKVFAPATADQIVMTDRDVAEQIRIENDYGAKRCNW